MKLITQFPDRAAAEAFGSALQAPWKIIEGESSVGVLQDFRTTDEAAAENVARIDADFAGAVLAGVEYPANTGRFLQIRDEDRQNIGNMVLRAVMALSNVVSFPPEGWQGWRMLDNDFLAIDTPQAMIALGDAANTGYLALLGRLWAAKAAIEALAADPEAMNADFDAVAF